MSQNVAWRRESARISRHADAHTYTDAINCFRQDRKYTITSFIIAILCPILIYVLLTEKI